MVTAGWVGEAEAGGWVPGGEGWPGERSRRWAALGPGGRGPLDGRRENAPRGIGRWSVGARAAALLVAGSWLASAFASPALAGEGHTRLVAAGHPAGTLAAAGHPAST